MFNIYAINPLMGDMLTGHSGYAYPSHINFTTKVKGHNYAFGRRGTTISFNIYKYFLK